MSACLDHPHHTATSKYMPSAVAALWRVESSFSISSTSDGEVFAEQCGKKGLRLSQRQQGD